MLKMRVREQIIDFVPSEEEPEESIIDKLRLVRDNPKTNEDVRLIIQFLLGEE